MRILKFGGKSLGNGQGIKNVISIVQSKYKHEEAIALVVSARGDSTDWLGSMLERARKMKDYQKDFVAFKDYQCAPSLGWNYDGIFEQIASILERTKLLGCYNQATKDLLLAQGEILSALVVSRLLNDNGVPTQFVDSRHFFITDDLFGSANIYDELSRCLTKRYFEFFPQGVVPVVTGFLASTGSHVTTTLGRNGSNYSASLLAKYLGVKGVESYTDVDGIFTADPNVDTDAQLIPKLTFEEAEIIAKSGAGILHEKTIQPLKDGKIPLHILNSFNLNSTGTLIEARCLNKIIQDE